jgi:alkylation response protein AidB-like acyl-CoA dehydrogenase
MDFRLSDETEQLRTDVREFLEEQITEELEERLYRTGVSHDPDFTRALAAKGWAAPGWPAEWGGQGRDKIEQTVIHEELRVVDAPTYGIGTTAMVAAVIREVGTDAQREAILPKALSGEIVIALGFTEPEAGSDVAAAVCRAIRDGDHWVIDGQKMFTTNAQIADYVFLLARTNLDVPKHKGLTMFLVPMKQPGVEVQGVVTMSGERTNISFYNDVHVSDEWRIGEVDGGWATMGVALGLEHGSAFGPALARLLGAAEEWAKEATGLDGRPRIEDPDVREVLGRTATSMEVSRLLQRRTAWAGVAGVEVPAPGPMAKLVSSEALERRAEEMVDVMGPDALRSYYEPTAPANGLVEYLLRFSLGTTIYAGTSEVHRNMIAQRALGLPRPR